MPITFRPEDEKLTTAYSFLLSTNNLPTPSQSLSTFITHTHDLVAEQWQVPPKRQTKFIRAQGLSAIAASGLPIEAVTPPNPSHSHLFEVVWPIPTNESYERVTSAEEKALCKRLGFQHVSLAIVQLKSVTTPVVVRAEPHEATVSQKGKSQAATTATPPAPAPPPTKTLTYSGKIFHLVYVDDSPEARLNPSNYRDVLWTPHDITKYNIVNHWVGISNTSGCELIYLESLERDLSANKWKPVMKCANDVMTRHQWKYNLESWHCECFVRALVRAIKGENLDETEVEVSNEMAENVSDTPASEAASTLVALSKEANDKNITVEQMDDESSSSDSWTAVSTFGEDAQEDAVAEQVESVSTTVPLSPSPPALTPVIESPRVPKRSRKRALEPTELRRSTRESKKPKRFVPS